MAAQPNTLRLPDVESMSAEEILLWAYETFPGKLALTCSWQKQSSALVHMVHELGLDIPIVELDTGLFFAETYATRERLIERYGLELIRPEVITIAEQHKQEGPNLWERDPDRCCELRKVLPLQHALTGFEAWITAIRRDQTAERAYARVVENDRKFDLIKINPLVTWTHDDVWGHLYAHDVPYNPLHEQGYPSIGCHPCTAAVRPGEDARAGRWRGKSKKECGLHVIQPDRQPERQPERQSERQPELRSERKATDAA